MYLAEMASGIVRAVPYRVAGFCEEGDVVNKIGLPCICIAMLFPAQSTRGQDKTAYLVELPLGAEPERMQNLLVLTSALATEGTAQSGQTDDARERAETEPQKEAEIQQPRRREAVRKIYAQVTPYPPRVAIWLKDGRRLQGSIAGMSSDTFLLRQKKNKVVTISYAEVVKGPVLPSIERGSEIGEGMAMFLAVGMLVTAYVWSYNATHR